jgi:hypothetical protein
MLAAMDGERTKQQKVPRQTFRWIGYGYGRVKDLNSPRLAPIRNKLTGILLADILLFYLTNIFANLKNRFKFVYKFTRKYRSKIRIL